jgi:short-subunit dehydrogenase
MKPTVIVAGVGPGIGASVARAFGRDGFKVALLARSATTLGALCQELAAAGVETAPFVVDLADADSRINVVGQVRDWAGDNPLSLVYNAVTFVFGPGDQMDVARERLALEVNVLGAVHLTSLLAPAMREARAGSILITGGGASVTPYAGMASLCAGKAALRLWALSLAEDLRDTGIRVGIVTVNGPVKPGTAIDPDDIAAAFLRLHHGTANAVEVNVPFESSAST